MRVRTRNAAEADPLTLSLHLKKGPVIELRTAFGRESGTGAAPTCARAGYTRWSDWYISLDAHPRAGAHGPTGVCVSNGLTILFGTEDIDGAPGMLVRRSLRYDVWNVRGLRPPCEART